MSSPLASQNDGDASPRRARGRPPTPERRVEILDIAAAMFAKEGYHGTTIRGLAERAGMNAASIYHYFASKEEALFEVCLAGASQSDNRIGGALAQHDAMEDRIMAIIASQVEDLDRKGDYRHVYFTQRVHLGPDQLAVIESRARNLRRRLEAMFAEAIERRELHGDLTARQAALTLAAALRALAQFYIDGPMRDYRQFAMAMARTLVRGLRR